MRRILAPAASLALILSLLPGCAGVEQTTRERPKTATFAGTGAVGGAIVGGLAGGKRGAVLGGLLGALSGGAIGHYLDEQEGTRQDTARRYDYSPEQGTRLRLESLRANPALLLPGETVNIILTYAVLTPSPDDQVLVREIREILKDGAVVGRASIEVAREGGSWRSIVPITLSAAATRGTYRVVASVESTGGGRDIGEAMFKVAE